MYSTRWSSGCCHSIKISGHFGASRITSKVLLFGFWWPTLFKDAWDFVLTCNRCQRMSNISKKQEMPLSDILEAEIFDVWGIDFMGPFPSSLGNKYILIMVDYISK